MTEAYHGEYVPKVLTMVGPHGTFSEDFEPFIDAAFDKLKEVHPEFADLNTSYYFSPLSNNRRGFVYFQSLAAANLFRGLSPNGQPSMVSIPDPDWAPNPETRRELALLKTRLPLVKANPDQYADSEKAKNWSYDVVSDYEDMIEKLERALRPPMIEKEGPLLIIPQMEYKGETYDFQVHNLLFSGLPLDDDDYPHALITNFRINGTREQAKLTYDEIADWLSFFAPEDAPEIHFNPIGMNAILVWPKDPRGGVKHKSILGRYLFPDGQRVALSTISKRLPPAPRQQRNSPPVSPARRRPQQRTPPRSNQYSAPRAQAPTRPEFSLKNSFSALSS